MTTRPTTAIELFYSYSHKDERLRNELEKHLSLLVQEGYISTWYDKKIVPGKEWKGEVDGHLNSAQIILLLISPDFMASDYCYDIEVKRAIERHDAGEACVIPIILRKVDWHTSPLGKLQTLPTNGKPVASWSSRDDAFYDVVQGIRSAINALSGSKAVDVVEPHSNQNLQSQPVMKNNISGLDRPATAFISYVREDIDEVKYLQQLLKVRGVRAWRDVTDLTLGGYTENEIVHEIEQKSDAFVIYVTQKSLSSDFIWGTEVPAALNRWERDHAFNIVPILRGVTIAELQQSCAVRGYRSLTQFNGVHLPDPARDKEIFNKELGLVAIRILEATLDLRLRRVGADRSYEPYIYLHTFKYEPPSPSLDLDLDWTELFKEKDEVPTEDEWQKILFPALQDVKKVLSTKTPSRRLHIFVQSILPAVFALGYALPDSAHFTLLLEGRHGIWSTEGPASASLPLRSFPFKKTGDAHVAVVEIGISRNTAPGLARNLPSLGLSFKHQVRFEPPGGPDHLSAVADASQALAMSHQIGRELRRLCDSQGVSHIHLFAALPAALAVILGHQLNALCPVTLYHYINADDLYVPVCTLGKSRKTT